MWTRTLVLALLGLGPCAAPARAEMAPKAAETVKAGQERLDALAARVRAKGDLPRVLVPEEAAVLAAYWEVRPAIGPGPFRKGDVNALLDMLQKRSALMQQYANFKTGGVEATDAERNISVFQDEIFRSMRSILQLTGAMMPGLQDMLGKRRPSEVPKAAVDGLRQARSGLTGLVGNGLTMTTHPGLKPENQSLIVDALADNAEAIVGGASLKERAAMSQTARSVMPGLHPGARDRLQVLLTALARPTCDGLCQIE